MTKPVSKTTPPDSTAKTSAKKLPSGLVGTNQDSHTATTNALNAKPKRAVTEPVAASAAPKFLHHPPGSSVEQVANSHTPVVNTGRGAVTVPKDTKKASKPRA